MHPNPPHQHQTTRLGILSAVPLPQALPLMPTALHSSPSSKLSQANLSCPLVPGRATLHLRCCSLHPRESSHQSTQNITSELLALLLFWVCLPLRVQGLISLPLKMFPPPPTTCQQLLDSRDPGFLQSWLFRAKVNIVLP